MSSHSSKEQILQATKELIWEHGYKAMSPKMIMKKSGVGQGSLYHHFEGKLDLAEKALHEIEEEMLNLAKEKVFTEKKSAAEQLNTYLTLPRQALKGCRMGRMTYDSEIVQSETLRLPVENYFLALHELIYPCVSEMIKKSILQNSIDPQAFTTSIIAIVQGGFILARAYNDPKKLDEATEGMLSLINNLLLSAKKR